MKCQNRKFCNILNIIKCGLLKLFASRLLYESYDCVLEHLAHLWTDNVYLILSKDFPQDNDKKHS